MGPGMPSRHAKGVLVALLLGVHPMDAADTPASTPPAAPVNTSVNTPDTSPVVARGQGVVIRAAELEARVRRAVAEITNSGRTVSAAQSKELSGRLLEQMIFTRLAAARANAADRARAQFESRAFIDGLVRTLGSPGALAAQLQAAQLTEAAFRAEKLEEALALAVAEREVRASIHLPDSDVRRYYDENPERWVRPEQVRVAHLLLATQTEKGDPLPPEAVAERKERLQKIREQARAGADFAALVKQSSDDRVSRDKGGEYTFARGEMDPAFEQAAFALKPGELSDIVTTRFGFHLLLGRERIPASRQSLDSVAADIRTLLVRKEQEVRMPEFAARLRREAKVEVFPQP